MDERMLLALKILRSDIKIFILRRKENILVMIIWGIFYFNKLIGRENRF